MLSVYSKKLIITYSTALCNVLSLFRYHHFLHGTVLTLCMFFFVFPPVIFLFFSCHLESFLAFIFPPALYLRASPEPRTSLNKIKASLLLAFGVALAILGTVQAIRNAVEGGVTEHIERTWCEAANSTNATSTTWLFP